MRVVVVGGGGASLESTFLVDVHSIDITQTARLVLVGWFQLNINLTAGVCCLELRNLLSNNLTWVCVSPRLEASSALSGKPKYWVR